MNSSLQIWNKSLTDFWESLSLVKETRKARCSFELPVDGFVADVLRNEFVLKSLNNIVEKQFGEKINRFFKSGTIVDNQSAPAIHRLLTFCCQRLSISQNPALIISNTLRGINALTVGSDTFSFIAISRQAVAYLNEKELAFLIGHECGHLIQKNLTVHTAFGILESKLISSPVISSIVMDLIEVPIHHWHRCTEITADRAGFICCDDLRTAQQMLLGSTLNYNFNNIDNWDEFVQDFISSENQDIIKNYFELGQKHPVIAKRLKALSLFAENAFEINNMSEKSRTKHQSYRLEEINRINHEIIMR
jgi:Zn-dependent protease with chaperone function